MLFRSLPLPPYITHNAESEDETRYQTVYARTPGSVAAPTAGLHFDEALLARLAEHGVNTAYVTLNVGAGTFQPVRVHDLSEHKMHTEAYFVPQATVDAIAATKAAGRRVVCVGTTSMRALESAARGGELEAGEAVAKTGGGGTASLLCSGKNTETFDLVRHVADLVGLRDIDREAERAQFVDMRGRVAARPTDD